MGARGVRARSCGIVVAVSLSLLAPSTVAATPLASPSPVPISAADETDPVPHAGDAADDPAIWVNHKQPSQSLIIGNDKQGSLDAYNLDGTLRQRVTTEKAFWGNVDVRQHVRLGGRLRDVAAASNGGLRLLLINRTTGELQLANLGGPTPAFGEGACLYNDDTGRLFAFLVQRSGLITQFRIRDADGDGLLTASAVRAIRLTSEAEGCVVDDQSDQLYVAQDDVGIWRYDARPRAMTAAVAVDQVTPAGPLVSDVEGLALVKLPNGGGLLIASVQDLTDPSNAYFAVYGQVRNEFLGTFDVVDGTTADGCERTDGIEAQLVDLGPVWPHGVFVCQDNENTAPGTVGTQDFKLVDLGTILDTFTNRPLMGQ